MTYNDSKGLTNLTILCLTPIILVLFASFGCTLPNNTGKLPEIHEGHPVLGKGQNSQSRRAKDIATHLQAKHVTKAPLNNQMSELFFNRFIQKLDPDKLYFQQKDINQLEHYRQNIANLAAKGNISPCNEIFDLFLARAQARLEKTLTEMPQAVVTSNLTNNNETVSRSFNSWPQSSEEADARWAQHTKASILDLILAGKPKDEIMLVLSQRAQHRLTKLKEIDQEERFRMYMSSLTDAYGGHTSYMSSREISKFNREMSANTAGIGLLLMQKRPDQAVRVVKVIKGGPGYNTRKIHSGDLIVGIAQGESTNIQDVVGWRIEEIIELCRGPAGSMVRLEIIPQKASHPGERMIIPITRDKVDPEAELASLNMLTLNHKQQTHKIATIKLSSFYRGNIDTQHNAQNPSRYSVNDVSRLLEDASKQGAEGIILDLRNNGGGALAAAAGMADLFIESGNTFHVKDGDGHVMTFNKDPKETSYCKKPLLVLINQGTASGAESFAGVMQDYQRALIVGSSSSGHGEVDSIEPLPQGDVLKITEAMMYRSSGRAIHRNGVTPDVEFPSLDNIFTLHHANETLTLPNADIASIKHPTYYPYASIIENIRKQHSERTINDPDFVYAREMAAYIEDMGNISTLSLNESTRRQQEQTYTSRYLQIEHKRTQSRNLPERQDDVPFFYNGLDEVYEHEAARILLDSIDMLGTSIK